MTHPTPSMQKFAVTRNFSAPRLGELNEPWSHRASQFELRGYRCVADATKAGPWRHAPSSGSMTLSHGLLIGQRGRKHVAHHHAGTRVARVVAGT